MIKNLYKLLYLSKGNKLYLIIYRIIKIFLNVFYPAYCYVVRRTKIKQEKKNVVISLTTFPARIDKVWITIETLLRQSYKPSEIILWLAENQFPDVSSLPKNLLEQTKRGLTIKFCDDIRSHKKYYYSMMYYPDKYIITVDDDTFYPEDLVENLIKKSNEYPDTVCCNIGHLITSANGRILPYDKWISGADGVVEPSDYLLPVGGEGILYPPKTLNNDVFNKEKIKELCPIADDLWLKAMATLNNVKSVKTNAKSITYVNIIGSQKTSLTSKNVGENMNDIQFEKILSEYPKLKDKWC